MPDGTIIATPTRAALLREAAVKLARSQDCERHLMASTLAWEASELLRQAALCGQSLGAVTDERLDCWVLALGNVSVAPHDAALITIPYSNGSSPDAREWYRLDMGEDGPLQIEVAMARFKAAHPDVVFGRHTILGIDRGEPWLCIDGWLNQPDDQGLPPTDADIPMGFV